MNALRIALALAVIALGFAVGPYAIAAAHDARVTVEMRLNAIDSAIHP
jgi:hypothetical protein